ncbi:MAG TPA: TadE/TadG family type IV pilus assembly protein [Bryobacteraceae bacterium]|jgi:Flp pilus assembly protein TadG|nr:TadE/TadG family type IV pilus assembly protein [Bryobacteraceae bacterium]
MTSRSAGQSVVEFSLVCLLLGILALAVIETGRMTLVYTTVANAARAGVRYAIVHGGSRTAGAGTANASGPGNNPAQVVSVIKNFAGAGILSTSRLVISVVYPGGSNAPGQLVSVTVKYPYDPLTTWLPWKVTLGSTTEGVIAF